MTPKMPCNSGSSVGHPILDRHHQTLLALCVEAKACSAGGSAETRQALRNVLEDLLVLADAHFQFEEAILGIYKFPHLADHKIEHEKSYEQLVQRINSANEGLIDEPTLCQFLITWISQHTLKSDIQYRSLLQNAA